VSACKHTLKQREFKLHTLLPPHVLLDLHSPDACFRESIFRSEHCLFSRRMMRNARMNPARG